MKGKPTTVVANFLASISAGIIDFGTPRKPMTSHEKWLMVIDKKNLFSHIKISLYPSDKIILP